MSTNALVGHVVKQIVLHCLYDAAHLSNPSFQVKATPALCPNHEFSSVSVISPLVTDMAAQFHLAAAVEDSVAKFDLINTDRRRRVTLAPSGTLFEHSHVFVIGFSA